MRSRNPRSKKQRQFVDHAPYAARADCQHSVAGTRFRRVREVVILKTLGATRKHVVRIFSVEFLTLGAVAGVMGAILATAFTSLVLKRLLDAPFQFDPKATLIAVVLTALLANASGWLASIRILGQKPLEVLRDE